MSRALRLLLVAAGSAAVAAGLVPVARADTPQEIYNQIKNIERRIDAPEPVGTDTVGVFDVRTGEFTGKRTEVSFSRPPDGGKPVRTEITPALDINGVRARVRFRLRHHLFTGAVTVTVNGRTRVPPAGRRVVSIDVGRARTVSWSITTSQGLEVTDKARIRRPRILGAGVFKLQAVPVAVIYEPPPPADPALTNSASYAQTSLVGTRISTSFSRGDSVTTPTTPFGFAADEDLKRDIGLLGRALSVHPKTRPAGEALNAIAGAMGSATGSEQEITADVNQRALEINISETDACETALRRGPGVGDVIVWLQGVRLVWFDDGLRTRLALLGADDAACKSAKAVRRALAVLSGPAAPAAVCLAPTRRLDPPSQSSRQAPCRRGLSAQTIQALLDQDPFVAGGPQTTLPSDRFEPRTGIIAEESPFTRTLTVQVTEDDTHARSRTTVTTEDFSEGLLSFIGVGPSETKTVTSTITTSSATSFRTGKTATTQVRIEGMPAFTAELDVFYDRVFGTFALQTP